ncbi:MAG: GNAT family N-acetyltransferase [Fibrobacter sp.]|nr:GNAT family N-acetyltransferase [Fibrobacter sp.]
MDQLHIELVSKMTEEAAKKVITTGLKEYFRDYDDSFNLDLENLLDTYQKEGSILLVAIWNSNVIGTGGLIKESENTGRIVRVSVLKEMRRQHIGDMIMNALEKEALKERYHTILLETTSTWEKARAFYRHNGYKIIGDRDGNTHFMKKLA